MEDFVGGVTGIGDAKLLDRERAEQYAMQDVKDRQLRCIALDFAIRTISSDYEDDAGDIINTASLFEAYLRGEQKPISEETESCKIA